MRKISFRIELHDRDLRWPGNIHGDGVEASSSERINFAWGKSAQKAAVDKMLDTYHHRVTDFNFGNYRAEIEVCGDFSDEDLVWLKLKFNHTRVIRIAVKAP